MCGWGCVGWEVCFICSIIILIKVVVNGVLLILLCIRISYYSKLEFLMNY